MKPLEEWIKDIREVHTRAKILTCIDRLKVGTFGDCKTLQEGVCELRIHYGPGIRIYYGKIGNNLSSYCVEAIKDPRKKISEKRRSI